MLRCAQEKSPVSRDETVQAASSSKAFRGHVNTPLEYSLYVSIGFPKITFLMTINVSGFLKAKNVKLCT